MSIYNNETKFYPDLNPTAPEEQSYLATAITRKSFKIFTVKQEKHDAIKLLAQGNLDSIADIISQAM